MKHVSKLSTIAAVLVSVHLIVFCAGFFGPYDYATQDRSYPYAPPMHLHFIDNNGGFHFRPFVYALVANQNIFGSYTEGKDRIYPVSFLVAGSKYRVFGLFDCQTHLFSVASPGRIFLFGTDGYGRDQFTRLLYGGQISLLAGLLATVICIVTAMSLGGIAGYFGGWVDVVIMRVAELFLAMPWYYLLFAARAFLPLTITPLLTFFLVVATIGLVGWARPARLIRGVVLSGRERNYVHAARGFGASPWYLLRIHILPQAYDVALTQTALLIPQYILAEVALSFLGLGVTEPTASWGNMLGTLQQYHVLVSYWWMALPVVMLAPISFCYYLLASELRKRSNVVAL